jgi:hypothetical protein
LIERITGVARTVKGVLDVAVFAPTVTEIGPLVAPAGTVTTRLVVVAETTVATVPLNLTSFAEGVALNPWPWIVRDVFGPPLCGVKPKMTRLPGVGSRDRLIWIMFPTAS